MLFTSPIATFIVKWWKKIIELRPSPLLILFYLILMGIGIFIYKQWTYIPVRTIYVNIYEYNPLHGDTIFVDFSLNLDLYDKNGITHEIIKPRKSQIDISLTSDYFNTDMRSDNIFSTYNEPQDSERMANLHAAILEHNKTAEYPVDTLKLRHLVGVEWMIKGICPYWGALSATNNLNSKIESNESKFIYVDSLQSEIQNYIYKPIYNGKATFICGFQSILWNDIQYNNGLISSPISVFKLEDISQQYIKLTFSNRNPRSRNFYPGIQMKNIHINTVGKCEISHKVRHRYYNDDYIVNNRLDGLDIEGNVEEIILYVEAKEGQSLQTLRLFFLTTLMTVVLSLFLGSSYSLIRNLIISCRHAKG